MVKGRVLPLTLVSRSNSILGKNEDVSKELDFAGCLRWESHNWENLSDYEDQAILIL